ncbi:MAG: hypothetical protein ACOH2I_06420 [Pseudomonas sp.]
MRVVLVNIGGMLVGVDKTHLPQEKVGSFIVSFMLLALSAMSYVPSIGQVSLHVFVVAYMLFIAFGFFFSGWWKASSLSCILLFMLVLLAVVSNFFVSAIGGISIAKWFRSFVPMFFFITLLLAPFYLRLIGVRKVFLALLGSCLSYCFFLFVFNVDKFYEFMQVGGRLTFYLKDSVVPYPFVGVILAALLPGLGIVLRVLLIGVFLFFVIAVGYKLQVLFLFGFFLFLAFSYPGTLRKVFIFLVLIFMLVGIFNFAGDYILQRLSTIGGGGDRVRMLEIGYAWSIFQSSPLWGGGLGLDVPLSLTRPIYAEQSDLWASDSVSYIHNFPLYLLMVGGLTFFVFFLLLIKSAGMLSLKNFRSQDGYVQSAVWCSLGLIVFFTTSAAFKQIQSVVILSFLIAVFKNINSQSRKVAYE